MYLFCLLYICLSRQNWSDLVSYNGLRSKFTITSRFAYSSFLRLNFWSQTNTHTPFNGLFPGLPGRAGTRKVKPIWILVKQEAVSGSGISWAVCKSAPHSRLITMPAPHHSSSLQAGCPSCLPTNSVKALKAEWSQTKVDRNIFLARILWPS